jgi:hypothetical protein
MKYISTLFVVIALIAVGTVNAQTGSELNGRNFTYMMKSADGTGPEIIDEMTFGTGQVTSKELGQKGFAAGNVSERVGGTGSEFDITFNKSNGGSYVYNGKAEGAFIHGTIKVTDANGTKSDMLFRGMLTEEWNTVQQQKQQQPKQQNTVSPHKQ